MEPTTRARATGCWFDMGVPGCVMCIALFVRFRYEVKKHERQSPMKNLEVSFSLLELKFKCKNLFLMWEKHLGARI